MKPIDNKIISCLRGLSVDMIDEAGSGHPGICLGAAPIIYTVYSRHLNVLPNNLNWINRDKFIMSAGHGSALLYSTLFLAGYDIDEAELKTFRKKGSRLSGHPERNTTMGIELTTGPLGQGIASAVGFAIGEEYLGNTFSKELFDNYTYVLCGDGDLMEGISYEAMSLAGSLKLNKLIVLYDSNNISLDGSINGVFNDNVMQRFESCGWHTSIVTNGEDVDAIDAAIKEAKKAKNKPSIIEVKTIIGANSVNAGTNKVHGKPLEKEDIKALKEKLGLSEVPFEIESEIKDHLKNEILNRVTPIYDNWKRKYDMLVPNNTLFKTNMMFLEKNNLSINLNGVNIGKQETEEELRSINGRIMNIISASTPLFLGGAADIASSTKTELVGAKSFKVNGEYGKNIRFGVREHLMGAITNALSLLNLKPFASTFLSFMDYMKPSIRLSALMGVPSIFVFSHDSVMIGEDGPTHQPIEQIGNLRSIINMFVFRPADINEVIASWHYVLNNKVPSSIVVGKEKVTQLSCTSREGTLKGAYVLNEDEEFDAILMATGTEVHTALKLKEDLLTSGKKFRVVSAPCLEAFELQSEEYKKQVLPQGIKVFTLEASNDSIWYKYASNNDCVINITRYGISASKDDVLSEVSFDYDSIKAKILENI